MFGIGFSELLLILVIVLVFFGGKNLPELSRNIGISIKEIKKGLSDLTEEELSKDEKEKDTKKKTKK